MGPTPSLATGPLDDLRSEVIGEITSLNAAIQRDGHVTIPAGGMFARAAIIAEARGIFRVSSNTKFHTVAAAGGNHAK